jgi:hypothetical protein
MAWAGSNIPCGLFNLCMGDAMTPAELRALLELAAKAAGIQFIAFDPSVSGRGPASLVLKQGGYWNPSTDDGDEARLEAALILDVFWWIDHVELVNQGGTVKAIEFYSDHGGDRQAARRKAGFRVAAEIGRMK